MAVIKAVSSKAGIETAIDYVSKEEKTEEKLLSGLHCEPETAKAEMQATKELWGKTGGRTYKHFIQSFAPDEKITPEQAHRLACRFAAERPEWEGFEVLIATHKDRKHVHTHFIVNSVNYENGHKLQQSRNDLKGMKAHSDRLCMELGLHITEKGKTFEGKEREETTAFRKDTYQLLKKAEQGKVKSYVQEIALAVLECKELAVSREDFMLQMEQRGYQTDWRDNHKYITWIDLAREKAGEKACRIRNNKLEKYYNMDFSKEGLEHEFEINARTTDMAKEQLRYGIDTAAIRADSRLRADSVRTEGHKQDFTAEDQRTAGAKRAAGEGAAAKLKDGRDERRNGRNEKIAVQGKPRQKKPTAPRI